MKYYGSQANERYPSGSPLGGRFKPKSFSFEKTKKPILSQEQYNKYKPDIKSSYLINESMSNAYKSLGVSLTPEMQAAAIKSGMTPEDINAIHIAAAKHVGKIITAQSRIRPDIVPRLAEYEVAWEDFGDKPVNAMIDHKTKQIILNPKKLLDKNSRYTRDGTMIRSITHEMTHQIDIAVGKGDLAFTELFKPLHEFMDDYIETIGPEKWMLDSGLAYPSTGYFGMTPKGMKLSGEYSAVISELYMHKPKTLDALDAHFSKLGYPGPTMREIGGHIWGYDNRTSLGDDKGTVDTTKIDTSKFSSRPTGGAVEWDSSDSLSSPLSAIAF